MFDIYTKEVKITTMGKESLYKLQPLSGKYFSKLMGIAKGINPNGSEDDFLQNLDEKTIENLHLVVFETLRISYPEQDPKKLERFATQNFMQFLPAVLEVNMGEDAGTKQS